MAHALLAILKSHTSPDGWSWFTRVLPNLFSAGNFAAAYAGVYRRLGNREIFFSSDTTEFYPFDARFMTSCQLSAADVGRMYLLLRASETLPQERFVELVAETYQHGDNLERQALLRSLQVLPHPPAYLPTAVEACRTHVTTVFEAIACENAYPCNYFPEDNFNQLVVKALFIGTPLRSILGLQQRHNCQLEQMVKDFSTERSRAGRMIPEDIHIILSRQR